MNGVDFLIIFLAFLSIARGADIGLTRQVASFAGLLVGLLASSYIASLLNLSAVASFLIIGIGLLGAIVGSEYVGVKLKKIFHEKSINKVDKLFGSVMGCFICLAFVWFCAGAIPAVPSTTIRQSVRDSKIISWLDHTLPPTTSIIQWLETSVAQTHIPEIISELELGPADTQVAVPDISAFQSVVDASRASIIEIEGRSCSGIGVGSGFIAAPNYIVTNAHVVAGMRHPYVQDVDGRHRATIVGFDPAKDIAILKTERLRGKPLQFSDNIVPIHTEGVVLGFPGGNPFTAQPAVVIEHFTAVGKDIYQEKDVRRDVYAIKSTVMPGNSGGPLIDESGRVIGVIFARSTTNEGVGYALSTPAVQQLLHEAEHQPSDTGSLRCAS